LAVSKKNFIYNIFCKFKYLLAMLPFEKRKLKTASYLYRTAQPLTLATFRSWGSSAGAGRIRLAGAQI